MQPDTEELLNEVLPTVHPKEGPCITDVAGDEAGTS